MEAELIAQIAPHLSPPVLAAFMAFLWYRIEKRLDRMETESKKRTADLHSKMDANARESAEYHKEATEQHHGIAERLAIVETKVTERTSK